MTKDIYITKDIHTTKYTRTTKDIYIIKDIHTTKDTYITKDIDTIKDTVNDTTKTHNFSQYLSIPMFDSDPQAYHAHDRPPSRKKS